MTAETSVSSTWECASAAPWSTKTPTTSAPSLRIILFFCCLLAACGKSRAPELAQLESLNPREIEPGEELLLEGNGFVVGPARLVLDGNLSAPGQNETGEQVSLNLSALATSSKVAVARLSRRHFERLDAQHTTFSGRAILRFASEAGPDAPELTATLEGVHIELFANPTAHQAQARQSRELGVQLLTHLGIEASPLAEGRGLKVDQVSPESLASQAEIKRGEVVVAAGSLTVASVSDLAPPPKAHSVVLTFRSTAGDIRSLEFPLDERHIDPDSDRIAALAIFGVALLLLLCIVGPFRRPLRAMTSKIVAGSLSPRRFLGDLFASGSTKPLRSALALLAFAAAPFPLLLLSGHNVVFAVFLVCLVSAAATAGEHKKGVRRGFGFLLGIVKALPMCLAATVAATSGASMELGALVTAQGFAPWQWEAFENPASMVLLLLCVATFGTGNKGGVSPAAAAARGLGGALLASTLLGGWAQSPFGELSGPLLFAIKSFVIGLCFPQGGKHRFALIVPMSALVTAAALAITLLALPLWADTLALWTARAVAGLLVIPAVVWLLVTDLWSGVVSDPAVNKDPPPKGHFQAEGGSGKTLTSSQPIPNAT